MRDNHSVESLVALIPTVVMAIIFVALLATVFRATDGSRGRDDGPDERGDESDR